MLANQSRISVTLLVVVLLATVAPSWGITIRHDRSDSQYTSLADTFFPYGGRMSGPGWYGSGTLISPTWVLTAKHALGTSFVTSAGSFSVAETIGHHSYDIGLARLSSPITTIDPISLYSLGFGIEDGQECTILGVGNTGTGLTGEVSGSGGARRAADTYVYANADAWGWGEHALLTWFRSPTGGAVDLEGGSAHGDSGGGLLLNVNGEYAIAGVQSLAWWGGGGGDTIGKYNTGGVYVRSGPLNNWITQYATDAVIVSDQLPGDVNGDGFVGGDDLTIILEYWGQSVTGREQGDLNGDFFVGGDDYSEVLTHWGEGIPPDPLLAGMPEPATLALLLLAGLPVLRRRRRA